MPIVSYKTEIKPNDNQKELIKRTLGVCRFVYNFYISHNIENYKINKTFISAYEFSKWLNNEYLPNNPEMSWIKAVSTKAVKQSILNAETAFKKFFDKKTNFPSFKKRKDSDVKMYFMRGDSKHIIQRERHKIKIPTLGWVRLKEKGYIPTDSENYAIISGTVSIRADRFYVSVNVEQRGNEIIQNSGEGIGIDLGVKTFATLSNGKIFSNINKTKKIKHIQKQIKREQRSFSRKLKNKVNNNYSHNLYKQRIKIAKLYQRISNIRTDYINKCVSEIAKTKPQYVTIENLNVKGMMKNRHLSKAISEQCFYTFRERLVSKGKMNGFEVRVADRFFPSSKMCHRCGAIKTDLRLSDRWYKCDCGYENDRDYNASLNLRDLKVYKTAT